MPTRRTRWACACLLSLLCSSTARGEPKAQTDPAISLRDLPGTEANWQEGEAIIGAPRREVHYWLTDYARWPERFPDMEWVEVLADDGAGRHVVRFHSRIAGMTFLLHEEVRPDLLVFEGYAPHVHTQGRIHLIDLGDRGTRVLMQSTAEVHGFIGLFATKAYKRASAFKVTTSHLRALLAAARLATGAPRPPP